MWKLLVPIAALVLVLIALVVADGPSPRAEFVYVERMDPTTLDMHKISWSHENRLASNLYEGLVRNDLFSKEFRQVPASAESWTISDDGLVYTFTMRRNAKWSNGQPLRAGDFVYSWRRGLLPDAAGDYAGMFMLVKGGEDFFKWREKAQQDFAAASRGRDRPAEAEALWLQTEAKFAELVGIKALDDRTLQITLERPTRYFLEILAYEPMGPVYPPLVEKYQSLDASTGMVRYDSEWTKPETFVCNGPMKLAGWRYKREVRMEKNEHYWNAAEVKLKSISIPSLSDVNTAVLAFETGAADWLTDVNAPFKGDLIERKNAYYEKHKELVAKLRAEGVDEIEITRRLPWDDSMRVHPLPAFGTYFLNFNCAERLADGRLNPFADARVRKAFAISFDRDNIARNIRRGGEPAARTLIPPGSIAGYPGPKGLACAPDPQAIATAQKLLADAGYPGGKGFITVEYLFNKDGGHDIIGQALKSDWEQNLGVEIRLKQVELKSFREDLKKANYMISRASWFGDYTDPMTFLDLNRTGDGNNDRKYSSSVYDGLLRAGEAERDSAKRMAILADAERLMMEEDFPIAPVFHYVEVYVFDARRVSGVSPHIRLKQYPWGMSLLKPGEPAKQMRSTEKQSPTRNAADRPHDVLPAQHSALSTHDLHSTEAP